MLRHIFAAAARTALIAGVLSSCQRSATTSAAHQIDLAAMDTTVAPGEDFAAYAVGTWRKATAIPADRVSTGTFDILSDTALARTRALIREAAATASASNPDLRKIGDFYGSYMDSASVERKGLAPLKPMLDSIAAIRDRTALAHMIGSTMLADVDALNNAQFWTPHLFGVWITQALDDPSRSVPYLMQGGLGMPDRDYYVSQTPQMKELRASYEAYVETVFRLAGRPDPGARAARVMALETKMAHVHATRVESEDVHLPVSWTRQEFATKAPGLDWSALLSAARLGDVPRIIVWHPKATVGLAALVASEPLDAWKDWLTFRAIDDVYSSLPAAFVNAEFALEKALFGTPEGRPRWERGVDQTSRLLGDAVGKEYVARYFPSETKKRVQAMVHDLITAFGVRIDALTWMTPETKAKAKAKLATLRVGVGYPDTWTDYSSLDIERDDLYGNVRRARAFRYAHQRAKLNAAVDRSEWWQTPQTVNASQLPLQNALTFPAAILAPPFFDPGANNARNYGAIGAVIGHEISHTFDNQGSEFDADGRLASWWTKTDFDHFKVAGEALAAQYDAYRPFPDLAVSGHQTLAENIADVAGLADAYDAYRTSLHGKELPPYHGFTSDQQFFISFGQMWGSVMRDPYLRSLVATDGHAPDMYRAATVRNIDAWYSAFSPKRGQKLYLAPTDRVRVW